MTQPVELDIPHRLGRDAARARIAGGIDKLSDFIPGGTVTENRWDGDRLSFVVGALGQRAAVTLDVLDDKVHLSVDLPPMLSLFAEKIRGKLSSSGGRLLK